MVEIEVHPSSPEFVVVPLGNRTDLDEPLPESLQPIVEETPEPVKENAPKKRASPKKRAKPQSDACPAGKVSTIECSIEPRGSASTGTPVEEAQEKDEVLKKGGAKESPVGRGRPQGARNKPRPHIIEERVVEVKQQAPELSVDDLRRLLQDSIRKQELEARSQKRAHYAQLLRANR
jgi:hypothetical protein